MTLATDSPADSPSTTLSPRRKRTREKRLTAIVSAAFDIIGAHSVEALTMARVADAVDLSAGALYRYFPSKDALIAALEARAIERIGEHFETHRAGWSAALPADPQIAALAELVASAAFYLGLARDDPRVFALVTATLGTPRPLVDDDDQAQHVAGPLRSLILRVSQLFARAASVGALDEGSAPLRTIVFWTSLHGVVSAQKLDRLTAEDGWFATRRLADELTGALLRGWGAPPSQVAAAHAWQSRRAQHSKASLSS